MNLFEFIATLISSLAWPVTVVFIAIIFRSSLNKIVISLTKLRWKDLELEFEKLELSSKALPEIIKDKAIPENERLIYSSLEEQIEDIAPRSPEGAILIAWAAVESALSSAVARLSISPDSPSYRSFSHNIDCLREYTELKADAVTINILMELKNLRNQVTHRINKQYEISVAQVLLYGKTAEKIIRILQNIKR